MSQYLKGKCSHGFNQLCGGSIDSTNSTSSLNSIQFGNKMLGRAIKRGLKPKSQWCDVGLWCTAIGSQEMLGIYSSCPIFSHFFLFTSRYHVWICFRNHSPNISMSKTPSLAKISRLAPFPPQKIKALVRRINIYSGTLRLSKATEFLRWMGQPKKCYTQDCAHLNSLPTLL